MFSLQNCFVPYPYFDLRVINKGFRSLNYVSGCFKGSGIVIVGVCILWIITTVFRLALKQNTNIL